MKYVPDGTFRKRASTDRPPTWWDHFYVDPELGKTVLLGKSERLRRHMEHRFYSSYGDFKIIQGWVKGIEWLLECHHSAVARNEAVQFLEAEEIKTTDRSS